MKYKEYNSFEMLVGGENEDKIKKQYIREDIEYYGIWSKFKN